MKIFQVIDSLAVGGAERMVVNISNTLEEEGHEVVVVCTRASGTLMHKLNPGIKQFNLAKKSFFDFKALNNFRILLQSYAPDLIHAHSSTIFWAILGSLFGKVNAKIIWHDHNGKRSKTSLFTNFPYILSSPLIYGIISVNEELQVWSQKFMLVNKERIKYIPNFPNINRGLSSTPVKGQIIILNIANLREPKDHLNLLKALNLLVTKHKFLPEKLKLVIVGKVDYCSNYFKVIDLQINENNLSEFVDFVGESDCVEKYLFEASIGVISSKSEGLPVSLLEYGLAGLPVVVTDVGQCAEVVGNGRFGKVVDPQDARAMANALKECMDAPEKAQEMGMLFKNHVQENYGSAMFLKSYTHLLNS